MYAHETTVPWTVIAMRGPAGKRVCVFEADADVEVGYNDFDDWQVIAFTFETSGHSYCMDTSDPLFTAMLTALNEDNPDRFHERLIEAIREDREDDEANYYADYKNEELRG